MKTLLNLVDNNGKQYLYYIVTYIKVIINVCYKNNEFLDYIYIFDIS